MDKISIVIPCYNMEKNMKKCISSIKKQTYKNFEVILVDDGSKDKTKEVIKKNILNDKRFKYYYKKNGGVSSARNFGLKKATGNYICFIDSDDNVEKDFIKLLYNSIKNNDADIAACYFNRIYGSFTNINIVTDKFCNLIKYPAPWNKMYRRDLFEKYNITFLEGKWYEDLGSSAKLLMVAEKISIVDKPIYNYIFSQNSSSIMHTYDDRIYQIYDIMEDIEKFAKENNLYEKNVANMEYIHIYHILVGTIYRSSFRDDFNKETMLDIIKYVENKFPNWYKNKYIKSLPITFKIYLFCLKNKFYNILVFMLKKFNNKIKL